MNATIYTCQKCEHAFIVNPGEITTAQVKAHCNLVMKAYHCIGFLKVYRVYYEEADGNAPKEFRCFMQAETEGEALQKAAEYLEVPSYDLVISLVQ